MPVLAVLCLLPAVQTAVAVYWEVVPAVTYPALKLLMIAVPLVLWRWTRRSRRDVLDTIGWKRPTAGGSLGMGVLMGGAILGGYYLVMRGTLPVEGIVAKVSALGLTEHYWTMALVISLWNSLFEEYYWRAFLLGEMRRWTSSATLLCMLGGVLFGVHHVFALLPLFPLWQVALFTTGTVVAGAVWCRMRLAGLSIVDCYVSHVLAALAVMWIGYDLILSAG